MNDARVEVAQARVIDAQACVSGGKLWTTTSAQRTSAASTSGAASDLKSSVMPSFCRD